MQANEHGMIRNPSMLFEFDDVESFEQAEADENLQPLKPNAANSEFEESVAETVREAIETYRLFEVESDYTRFVATFLKFNNFHITVRTSCGGKTGTLNPLQNLRHRFIICTESDPESDMPNHVVIDPQFKEHFALARP